VANDDEEEEDEDEDEGDLSKYKLDDEEVATAFNCCILRLIKYDADEIVLFLFIRTMMMMLISQSMPLMNLTMKVAHPGKRAGKTFYPVNLLSNTKSQLYCCVDQSDFLYIL
jgi:hypothetical protein